MKIDEEFYGPLRGLDWTDKPDWADQQVATWWRDSMNWTMNAAGPRQAAHALRCVAEFSKKRPE